MEPTKLVAPTRVNPYSVIDITPFQEDQPPPPDPEAEDESVSLHVPSGYSVPVPCGYAVPCSLPLLLPAYSSPVIIRATSLDEEGSSPPVSVPPRVPRRLHKPVPPLSSRLPGSLDVGFPSWEMSPVTGATTKESMRLLFAVMSHLERVSASCQGRCV